MTQRQYTIVPYVNKNGVEHLRLLAGNGEIVMGSENFSKPGNAMRAAKRLQEAATRGFRIGEKVFEKPARKPVAALLKKAK